MKYSITFFLLSLLFLCSCQEEEIGKKTQPLPDGVMRLSATVRNGVKTRALNDPLSDATVDEKRVDRIAFFVYTEAEGMQVYVPAATGETYDDYPNKVHLTDNLDGTYEAKVDLTAGAGYEADVIAVANLPEDYDYTQIVNWAGLLDSVTVSTTTMPLCTGTDAGGKNNAFVMYSQATGVALRKEKEAAVSFTMERLVARIDITNKAYGTGKNAFKLTKARILQAKPASYIMPHDLYASPEVVTVNDWELDPAAVKLYKGEVNTANETTEAAGDAVCQAAWHALYTYENDEVAHTPTCLEVTGEMNGATITRKIPFEVTAADGITKNPVPIVRNHRYLVQINPAPGLTDITYKLTVDEWNAVDTVNVQPNQTQVPILTAYVCAEASKTYGGDPVNGVMPDSIVVPATGGTITFTASCPFDSRVTFGYVSDEDKGLGDGWFSAIRGEAVVTKGDVSISREYTVTVVKDDVLDASLVKRGYIYIANGGNGSVMDTVAIYQGRGIAYADTRFAAVLVGKRDDGSDIVWAPFNVGATEVATDITSGTDEDILAQCGFLYQWGRNVPFKYGVTGDEVKPSTLPKYEEACRNEGTYANKFIKGNSWFTDNTTPLPSSLTNWVWPRKNDPCPVGWRIVTESEMMKLKDKLGSLKVGANGCLEVEGLIWPAVGLRDYSSGAFSGLADKGFYWSATLNTSGLCPRIFISSSDANLSQEVTGFAFPIRCVQE